MIRLMGQLPEHRANPSHVFSQVGVDYAGHLSIKKGNPRNLVILKAYACIFVYLAIKAVHIELVKELSM